ncbi:SNF7 family protein [Heterostelium album PN500]|uniref:SNF7 family protein n=1 Tax=Heterostelium pallidum (strain ATCC 26659 / Pp 5 / PN500) TaxID=670386 RepID=D3B660_HETP5|nr:SNF7 family protein [Heterostelium album PN500]EFA83358.1 SNF7 family protein [Heterostelium album PN500]|eukprot:XP_020435475.1 SNF7 family protein [Heterostelium album PN500]
MGGMFSFCGGSARKDQISDKDKAVLELKIQRDKLKQYQIKINLVIQRETEIARECAKNNKKQQAILALKKRKYQEKLLEDTDQNLMNIQEMVSTIEQAHIQIKIAEQLKQGNNALKELHKEMSLEEIENIMSDTQDAVDYQNEISEALSGKFTQEEEDELMAELDQMEKQQLKSKFPEVPNNDLKINVNLDHVLPTKLPSSPKSKPIAAEAEEIEVGIEEVEASSKPTKERDRVPEMAI